MGRSLGGEKVKENGGENSESVWFSYAVSGFKDGRPVVDNLTVRSRMHQ